jgi:hypothetical protein
VKGKWRRTYLEEDSEQSAAICSSRAISNTQWKFFLMLYLERVTIYIQLHMCCSFQLRYTLEFLRVVGCLSSSSSDLSMSRHVLF